MLLAGRTAIVTGAARGIGRAIAEKLAFEGGANVAMVDVEEISLSEESSTDDEILSMRRKNAEEISKLLDKISEDHEGVQPSVLINCAGITRDAFLWKMSEENYDDVMNVNMKAPFFLTREFSRRLLLVDKSSDQHEELGSIVNISSIIGKVGNMGQTNYAASKGGLIAFTKACARTGSESTLRTRFSWVIKHRWRQLSEKIIESMKCKIPMGHLGEPEDIAESACFKIPKSKYITGACLEVTGLHNFFFAVSVSSVII